MDVRVNLVSGEVYTFDLPVDRPIEFLNKIKPAEIFERPLHQFLGKIRTVSINPRMIEWIELDTIQFPSEAPFAKSTTFRQLSAAAFQSWIKAQKDSIVAAMEQDSNNLLAYGKASFQSGNALHFEIRSKMGKSDDRVKQSQKIFSMPALFVYGETSGLFLVNTKNIAAWQVVPGLKKSTTFSVAGELKSVHKAKSAGAEA